MSGRDNSVVMVADFVGADFEMVGSSAADFEMGGSSAADLAVGNSAVVDSLAADLAVGCAVHSHTREPSGSLHSDFASMEASVVLAEASGCSVDPHHKAGANSSVESSWGSGGGVGAGYVRRERADVLEDGIYGPFIYIYIYISPVESTVL